MVRSFATRVLGCGEVGHVLVYADDLGLARAAFKAGVQQWPKQGLRLRQGALTLEEHKPR